MSDKFKRFDDEHTRSGHSRNRRFIGSNKKKNKKYTSEVERRRERIEAGKLRSRRKNNFIAKTKDPKASSSEEALIDKKKSASKRSVVKVARLAALKPLKKTDTQTRSSRKKQHSRGNVLRTNRSPMPAKCVGYGSAFVVAFLLLLVGATDSVMSDGILLIFIGFMLYRVPELYSKGWYIDICVIAFLLLCLTSFIPASPEFYSNWRGLAADEHGLYFGVFHSLRPLLGLEGLLIFCAFIALYYNMGAWKVNGYGKDRLFFITSLMSFVLIFSDFKLSANPLKIFLSEAKHFSPIENYPENFALFIFVLGISSLGLCINGFKYKIVGAFVGLLASVLCYLFLLKSNAVLYSNLFLGFSFFALFVWFKKQHSRTVGLRFAWISGLGLISIILLNWASFFYYCKGSYQLFLNQFKALYLALIGVFKNSAFFGFGLGSSRGLMPQFNSDYNFESGFASRGTDLMSWVVDFGLLGMVILILFLGQWAIKNIPNKGGFENRHKPFCLMVIFVFALRFMSDSGSTGVALILLLLLFFQLASRQRKRRKPLMSRLLCRILGVFWIIVGSFWLFSSMFNWPLHSDIRSRIALGEHQNYLDSFEYEYELRLKPNLYPKLDPKKTEQKASLIPSLHPAKPFSKARKLIGQGGDPDLVAKALEQGRFLDPNNERLFLNIGYWTLESNPSYALESFDRYFQIEPHRKLNQYKALLHYLLRCSEAQFQELEPLSNFNEEYRVHYLLLLKDQTSDRLRPESFEGFSLLNRDLKYRFLEHLIKKGHFEIFDTYVILYLGQLEDLSILKAIKAKELADFEGALSMIRKTIDPPRIPLSEAQKYSRESYHYRVFIENNPDLSMGISLLVNALDSNKYIEAKGILGHLLRLEKPPLFVYYWYAEVLYILKDYEESWFAFESYIQKSKIRLQ